MKIAILITNPNHHVDLTLGVAVELKRLGNEVKYISLCELRRMESPKKRFLDNGLLFETFPTLPGGLKPSSGKESLGGERSIKRRLIRFVFWRMKIRPFVKDAIKNFDRILLMNDSAFPGDRITNLLRKRVISFDLLQEGIRFPLPNESETKYGGAGARKIYVWGERSATHFEKVKLPSSKVIITGSPRFDMFMQKLNDDKGEQGERILGVFTNPIDDQGFCSKLEKLKLFESFVKRAANYLNSEGVSLGLKCHPREQLIDYQNIANKYIHNLIVLPIDISNAINKVEAGVIMASTVGLELLAAGKNIAQIEIPGFGYVFDYNEASNFVPIPLNGDIDLTKLFFETADSAYFESHVRVNESIENLTKALTSEC